MTTAKKWAIIFLSTCGVKGIAGALILDLSEVYIHTAEYLQMSCVVTGLFGGLLLYVHCVQSSGQKERDQYMWRVRGEKWNDSMHSPGYSKP